MLAAPRPSVQAQRVPCMKFLVPHGVVPKKVSQPHSPVPMPRPWPRRDRPNDGDPSIPTMPELQLPQLEIQLHQQRQQNQAREGGTLATTDQLLRRTVHYSRAEARLDALRPIQTHSSSTFSAPSRTLSGTSLIDENPAQRHD